MFRLTKDDFLVVGVLVVIVITATFLIFMPQGKKLDNVREQISSQKMALESDSMKASVVPTMVKQVEDMKKRYQDFDRRLPKQKELAGFLRDISDNLRQEDIPNIEIEPGNPKPEELFHTLPIVMRFKGSYLSLARFLKRVDQMERLTRVQELNIAQSKNRDETGLEIELHLNIYFTKS